MAENPVAFEGEDDFDRAAQAIRYTERLRADGPEVLHPKYAVQPPPAWAIIRVTGSRNATSGLYPAIYTYYNPDIKLWWDGEECRAVGVTGPLIVGQRYGGRVVAVRNEGSTLAGNDDGFQVVEALATIGGTGDGCGWLSGLRTTDCLAVQRLSVSGTCDCSDTAPAIVLGWDSGSGWWTTPDEVVPVCGVDWTPWFQMSGGIPAMKLTSTAGTVWGTLDGCTASSVTFGFGGPLLCIGSSPIDCDNVLRLTLTCTPPNRWWCVDLGSGVHGCVKSCVRPAGTISGPYSSSDECTLACTGPWWCTSSTVCEDTTKIGCVQAFSAPTPNCGGPYPSASVCAEHCQPAPFPCDSFHVGSMAAGTLTVSNQTGDLACWPASGWGLTSGGLDDLTFTAPGVMCAGLGFSASLDCTGGVIAPDPNGQTTFGCGVASYTWTRVAFSLSPLIIVYDLVVGAAEPCTPGGSCRFTFTLP